jgi:asparagine N-glycosylation enzyme membrane subunit Stt3
MTLVGLMVCAFIGMCMVGSAVIGWLVDKSKAFKRWLVISLFGSAIALLYLIWLGPRGLVHIWASICLLGFFMGPVQPLSIETAVEVTYPAPESSVTAVQQVLGNLFSAALFPLILLCRNPVTKSMQPALLLILVCLLGTGAFYLTYAAKEGSRAFFVLACCSSLVAHVCSLSSLHLFAL